MKLGVRAHDFGRQSAESLASAVKAAGFDCVQLAPAKALTGVESFEAINGDVLEDIHKAFVKNDVEITVLGCYIEPSLLDNERRLANVETFKNNLTHAKRLGVSIVGTETTGMDIKTPAGERDKVYQILKDSVLRMVEHAEKEQVYVGIEPVAEHTLNTPELTRRLLDEVNSEYLKIIFDPVNLILPDTMKYQVQIFNEVFHLLGNDIAAVHVKDIVIENGQKAWRNIGLGEVDYDLIMGWLKQNKPDIHLLREDVKMDSYKLDRDNMARQSFYQND